MLLSKDYRDRARSALGLSWLGNRWGSFAVITLIYMLITAACGAFSIAVIGLIAGIILMGPLEYGMDYISLKAVRGENFQLNDLFEGLNDIVNKILLYIINAVLVFLWSLLFVIPGIIKLIEYSMSYYVLCDNPTMAANEARLESMRLMQGNKWRYFCLMFSFIGWIILSGLTFGILLLWVIPYVRTATAAFYESLVPVRVDRPVY